MNTKHNQSLIAVLAALFCLPLTSLGWEIDLNRDDKDSDIETVKETAEKFYNKSEYKAIKAEINKMSSEEKDLFLGAFFYSQGMPDPRNKTTGKKYFKAAAAAGNEAAANICNTKGWRY